MNLADGQISRSNRMLNLNEFQSNGQPKGVAPFYRSFTILFFFLFFKTNILYFPDIALYDDHMFFWLNDHLYGLIVKTHEEVEASISTFFSCKLTDFNINRITYIYI